MQASSVMHYPSRRSEKAALSPSHKEFKLVNEWLQLLGRRLPSIREFPGCDVQQNTCETRRHEGRFSVHRSCSRYAHFRNGLGRRSLLVVNRCPSIAAPFFGCATRDRHLNQFYLDMRCGDRGMRKARMASFWEEEKKGKKSVVAKRGPRSFVVKAKSAPTRDAGKTNN